MAAQQVPPLCFETIYQERNINNPSLVTQEELAKYRLSAERHAREGGPVEGLDGGATAKLTPTPVPLAGERSDGQADARSQTNTMQALPFCSSANFV